ncbi:MAG: hypothetical protein LBI02_09305 [Opitutaceae bacterium]|nr:hypothetical protein [Opitutaceae bacterium]
MRIVASNGRTRHPPLRGNAARAETLTATAAAATAATTAATTTTAPPV